MTSAPSRVPASGQRVLIVEDEATLAAALSYSFRREGFDVTVANDGLAGLEAARAGRPHLVILDIMLPKVDGLEVCRRLRAESGVPIIMLTAKGEEIDRVVGLEIGADDYVTKPFGMRELLARARALLRRASQPPASDDTTIVAGDLVMDPRGRSVARAGTELALRPKEFDLLFFLASHPGQVFTREQLLSSVWGFDFYGGRRTVDVHVRWLRAKIEDDPAHPRHLLTSRGAGYKFVP